MERGLLSQIETIYGVSRENILTVSQVSQYIRDVLVSDPKLKQIYVMGEATNVSEKQGYLYFDIKDEEALLRCVVFPESNINLPFKIENGLEIVVFGSISTYMKRGLYQIVVSAVFPLGEGAFYLQFKQLKEKLSIEGLFDEKYKKEIPVIPKSIGLITSKTGAAYKDILQILKSRFPNMTIKLVDTPTQGDKASREIIKAIQMFNYTKSVDVIILARGGGSVEDLMCFNDEELARTIFTSKIPIITGIGHETDYTIADLVADKRAPTPSIAAKIAVIDKRDLIDEIDSLRSELQRSYNNFITSKLKDKKLKRYKVAVIVLTVVILLITVLIMLAGL
ncbi:exodeoxyribonuclease VII large subunit [bacterium]|nr:exodeoxyribonuclease VII large subunit [bacterium]